MEAHIGRIEELTDRHWHGHLSTSISFAGCDFNCPGCNTPELLIAKEEHLIDIKEVKKKIRQHSGTIEAVVFTGGEPCLQRQVLISLASFSKDAGLKTALVTNGSKTECIRSLLSLALLDTVILDIKAPFEEDFFQRATLSRTFFKTTAELLEDIRSTLRLLKKYQDAVEIIIRTTITPTLVSRKEDLLKIAEKIDDMVCVWELVSFSPENVDDRRFSAIRPPSREFLENLAGTIRKMYPRLRVFTG